MKTLRAALIAVSCLTGSAAFAEDPPPKGERPCLKIENACTAAGFAKGEGRIGKGLRKDCLGPLMVGQKVSGVTVDPADVQACIAARAKHLHKGDSSPTQTPPP